MRQFKFFKGHIGTLDAVDGQTYATASIYNPNTYLTPEESERLRIERINRIEEQQLRLFQATTTITVNPTLWTKIKIFGTQVKLFFKECWQYEPIGLIFVTILFCLVSFIGIMKLFGA